MHLIYSHARRELSLQPDSTRTGTRVRTDRGHGRCCLRRLACDETRSAQRFEVVAVGNPDRPQVLPGFTYRVHTTRATTHTAITTIGTVIPATIAPGAVRSQCLLQIRPAGVTFRRAACVGVGVGVGVGMRARTAIDVACVG